MSQVQFPAEVINRPARSTQPSIPPG